jgi:hypothetical protein
MRILLRIILLLLLMSSWETGVGSDADERVLLSELITVGSGELDNITGIAVDPGGNIYATERMFYSVKKFSPEGVLIAESGRRGGGPGEFGIGPSFIGVSDSILAIVDHTTAVVQVFTPDLDPIARVTVPVPPHGIRLNSNRSLWLGIPNAAGRKEDELLRQFDLEGDRVSGITLTGLRGHLYLDFFEFSIDTKDNFIVAYNTANVVEVYTPEGERRSRFSVDGLPAECEMRKIGGMEVPRGKIFENVAVDTRGKIYLLAGSYAENPLRDIHIFEYDGKPVGKVTLPHESKYIYIDVNDRLYATNQDATAIIIYRISYL